MAEDIDTRLAAEVAALSTKLVTEVARLLQLEETVYLLRRENHTYKQKLDTISAETAAFAALQTKYNDLLKRHDVVAEENRVAQAKTVRLEAEVEDLTASLFDEANKMVLTANRDTYNFKVKNRKLIEELEEKDTIISDLQSQLLDLKTLFQEMEDQNRARDASAVSTPFVDADLAQELNKFSMAFERRLADELDLFVYCPRARSVRFDLPIYQRDFKAFVYQISKPEFSFDLASLKSLKYFRKVYTEEIEPALGQVPTPTGSFMNRWATGRSFWSFLVEGKARIEPVSGVNETFKVSYKGPKTGLEIPVALEEPCGFCGEHSAARLEHARLYNLKLYSPTRETKDADLSSTTDIGGESHHTVGLYPLCNYCLVKLRAICEFFAKLRVIHSNIYKIKPNPLFNDISSVSSSFQFKRSQELITTPKVVIEDEPIFVKLYLLLLAVRAKIFWSRSGFWDTEEDVESMNVDDIKIDAFKDFVATNVSFQEFHLNAIILDDNRSTTPRESKAPSFEKLRSSVEVAEKVDIPSANKDLEQEQTQQQQQPETVSETAAEKLEEGDAPVGMEVDEEVEKLDDEAEQFHDSNEMSAPPANAMQRKKSKSKAFKKKMNRDLDDTIEMLKENLQ